MIPQFFRRHYAIILITILTIIAFLLRIYHLGTQDYFSEEIATVTTIRMTYYQIIANVFIHPESGQAPLYYLIAKVSAVVIGTVSLESIRLPAAILGTLCVPAAYALGREYHSEITGILAALVITVSDRMVFYSQYGRPYTLVFLFFILTAYCFVKIQKGDSFRAWMPLFVITSGLCLISHYYSIIPISVLWGILIWQRRKEMVPYIVAGIVAASAFLLYIRVVIGEYLTSPISALYPPSIFNVTWIDNLFRVPYECFGYLAIPLIVLFLIHANKDRTAQFLGLSAGVTYLSMLILTIVFDPSARYAVLVASLIIVPAMVPVTGLINYWESNARRILLFSFAAYLIIGANILPLISWYTTTYKFVFL